MTQLEALNILKMGKNVFLTGAAGSGKTHVLRQYIDYLKKKGVEVGITASTGIAATHMGGMTIHAWSGIGIKDRLTPSDIDEIVDKSYLRNRLKNAHVLIIDEVSMLHHFRLDLVDAVLRRSHQKDEPFGGVQVVLSGDFFQLPPVSRAGERESRFAYHSSAWKDADLRICYLSEQHRQNDMEYLSILNAIRDDNVGDFVYELLQSRHGKAPGVKAEPTRLYSHNRDVDTENEQELSKLPGQIFEYDMESRGRGPLVEALKKSCLAPEKLRLKEGARVMFVKNNFEEGYANGTLGVVVKCGYDNIKVATVSGDRIDVEMDSWRIEEEGATKAEIAQYPLRLAWAITVHKSQGMSLDAALVDLSQSFERGMGYVALSRVRSLDGLSLKGMNENALLVNEEVLQFDKDFRTISDDHAYDISLLSENDVEEGHEEFIKRVAPEYSGGRVRKKKEDTVEVTKNLVLNEMSLREICAIRGLQEETIIAHIEKIKAKDPRVNILYLSKSIPQTKMDKMLAAFRKVGMQEGGGRALSPVKQILGEKFSFQEIRLARLFV